MSYETIIVEKGNIAKITLNRRSGSMPLTQAGTGSQASSGNRKDGEVRCW